MSYEAGRLAGEVSSLRSAISGLKGDIHDLRLRVEALEAEAKARR